MSRVVRSLVRLKSDIEGLFPQSKVEVVGDPDGLDTHRSLRVTGAPDLTASVLHLANDGRIDTVSVEDDGVLITLIAGWKADIKEGFPISAALEVAKSHEEVAAKKEPAPKKAATKKTAAKKTAAPK